MLTCIPATLKKMWSIYVGSAYKKAQGDENSVCGTGNIAWHNVYVFSITKFKFVNPQKHNKTIGIAFQPRTSFVTLDESQNTL